MVNKFYEKGKRLEQGMVRFARENGMLAFRSAGSHSKIDCCLIDIKNRKIWFIQGKAGKLSQNALKQILDTLPPGDEYFVKSLVITNIKEFKKKFSHKK